MTAAAEPQLRAYHQRIDDARWTEIVEALTRRGLAAGAIALAYGATLAGCASGGDDDQSGTGEKTIDFSFAGYSAKIPAQPKRVVTLEGRLDLEFALTTGYPVVASVFALGREGALFDELADNYDIPAIKEIGVTDGWIPVLEEVASHQPDLIVSPLKTVMGAPNGAEFAKIAPVLAIAGVDEDPTMSWQDGYRRQAGQLRRSEQADNEIARYDEALRAAKADLARLPALPRVASGTITPAGDFAVWSDSLANRVFADLNVEQPLVVPGDPKWVVLSPENFERLDQADVLIMQNWESNPTFQKSEAVQRLRAVRNGRVYNWDGSISKGFARAATGIVKFAREALLDR